MSPLRSGNESPSVTCVADGVADGVVYGVGTGMLDGVLPNPTHISAIYERGRIHCSCRVCFGGWTSCRIGTCAGEVIALVVCDGASDVWEGFQASNQLF